MTRSYRPIALALVVLLLAALPAAAGWKATFQLRPPAISNDLPGVSTNLAPIGAAKLMVSGGTHYFMVRVFADIRDNTMLDVFVATEADPGPVGELQHAGRVQMILGSGLLSVNSKEDACPAFPVTGITKIVVKKGNKTLLVGMPPNAGTP